MKENEKVIDKTTEDNVNSIDEGEQLQNLENCITTSNCMSESRENYNMTYKINRKVIINGVSKTIHANTEQEYTDKVLSLHNEYLNNSKHKFKEYAVNWFNIFCKPNVETVTYYTYERQLKKYILPSLGDKYLEDITTDDVQKMFNKITNGKASKNKVKTVLNQVLEAAVEDEYISRNPLTAKRLKIKGKASKPTRTYSVEQMKYIISHIDDIKTERDRVYIVLQALHPMRLEEVLGLKWSDIDFDNMTIHIQRAVTHPARNAPEIKAPKTESSNRYIGLASLALDYLKPTNDNDDFILGGEEPLSYTAVRRMCERIAADIGFNESITPRRFRTTVLSDIYSQTKDIKLVQEAAGHTTTKMTLEYYVKERSDINGAATAIELLYCNQNG